MDESLTTLDSIARYITAEWSACVRCGSHRPHIVSIPIPHTVPSPRGQFQAMFYWDLYFTNLGLMRSGRIDLARSNCDALLWWIDRQGFVPNSAFVGDDNRSQPPVLAAMVREVYSVTRDRVWAGAAVARLEKEYDFWVKNRSFADGLAHHGHQADDAYLERFYDETLCVRLGASREVSRDEKTRVAGQRLAEAESGLDFTPLFGGRALDHADIKLNTLLWTYETNLAWFARALDAGAAVADRWASRAEERRRAIDASLWDDSRGIFRPRNIVTNAFSPVADLETFYPLWAGLATPEQARRVRDNLVVFEHEFGLSQTEILPDRTYQWAYPNGWPPSHWIVASGLRRYGFDEDACRIARKYCETQRRLFVRSSHLWEKVDVTTGDPGTAEYGADPMLGWTAGVFIALLGYLDPAWDNPRR
jgi:alpha,alpha-trehalase